MWYTVSMANEIILPLVQAPVPPPVAAAGELATRRFIEFFTANIRNRNTREAYARAVADFFRWTEEAGLRDLQLLQPVHVAAYVEQLGQTHSAPSVKQHLAAVRMLFDWLVVGQVVSSSPASVVRGPRHVVK
jgi:site-specific recombinase XerD